MLFVGLGCGAGGVIVGGYLGDAFNKRARGGHAKAIGLSMLLAVPFGVPALLTHSHIPFMILTAAAALGLGLRLHADQLARIGAPALGVRLGAASIDHLEPATDPVAREPRSEQPSPVRARTIGVTQEQ